MTRRDELPARIRAQHEENPDVPPVVTLDEYFTGHSQEDCIAPNQQLAKGRWAHLASGPTETALAMRSVQKSRQR